MRSLGLKTREKVLWFGLAIGLSFCAVPARANLEVSGLIRIQTAADFYVPLSATGTWVEVHSYGRCWRPAGVTVEWRPYCNGHWVWTDCGWYWASDEPWSWACYHYGGWIYDPVYAWVWVPGIEWAPAWVSWRVGGGYIGWAPLAPRGATVAEPQFVFAETSRFTGSLRPRDLVINNPTILNRTKVVSNVRQETKSLGDGRRQKVFVNEGPGLGAFDRALAMKVRVVPIQEAARQAPLPHRLSSDPSGEPPKGRTAAGFGEQHRPEGESRAVPAEPGEPPTKRAHQGRNSGPAEGKSHGHDHE